MSTNHHINLLDSSIKELGYSKNGFCLQKSEINNGKLNFNNHDGFDKAIRDGFFLLKIPKELNLAPGIKISENFYSEKNPQNNSNDYKGFKEISGIYFDREHFQTEHILLDKPSIIKHFPYELQYLSDEMNNLAIIILKNIFKKIGLAESDWQKVTGGAINNQGTHWFASSHYRANVNKPGCATHKDTGFVTILYINEDGLEAMIDEEWRPIYPCPGYFVINFGGSLEILTSNMNTPIKAVLHRVKQIKKLPNENDRYSFATFLNIPTHLNLYQYDKYGELHFYQTVKDFLNEFNKNAWDDKHTDFGLK